MTHRFNLESAPSRTIKAVAFGAVAAVVMGLGIAHAEGQREARAQVVTLDPVVITVKRQQLPTVYITGKRDTSADGVWSRATSCMAAHRPTASCSAPSAWARWSARSTSTNCASA